ncbi:ABC transporter permease [Mangrovihabitans endophyticus]|uniref:Nitrate ABC transporter permease n=1 Tax=Mangrovihabitans endophyticus TaxID=1751298 RepID=A0A8J3C0J3_9ACTN|nr:ABC transporter permease subunit [Mangrovihabitans endophyticus]GGK91627.1 nitrate ABC transporter permease [Mangrovihabitans endophyticus]
MTGTGRIVRGATGIAAVVALSELLAVTGVVPPGFLPPASAVLARAAHLVVDPAFLAQIAATVRAWLTGLAVAVAVGVPAGLLIGGVPAAGAAVRPVLEFLRPIPSVALIPLVSLLLGAGRTTEVTLVAFAATWPVLFNTVYGVQDQDPVPRETLRVFGFGRATVLWLVALPAAAPFIATGVRLAAAVGLILAVGTEILAGFGDGLGVFIAQAQQVVDGTVDVLAGTVCAGVLGLVANAVLAGAERRLFHWHPSQRPLSPRPAAATARAVRR